MRAVTTLLLGAVFTLSTSVLSSAHHIKMERCFEQWHTHAAVELLADPASAAAVAEHAFTLASIVGDVCGQIQYLQNVVEYDYAQHVLADTGLADTFYRVAENLDIHPLRLVAATVYVMDTRN